MAVNMLRDTRPRFTKVCRGDHHTDSYPLALWESVIVRMCRGRRESEGGVEIHPMEQDGSLERDLIDMT